MRSISVAGLAQLATRYGGEPVVIIEVDWSVGRTASYADRDVGTIPGRIIDVGDLDNVVGVSNNSSSQSLDVTLDDTDGTIKAIFDGYDIHKRDARVYQWFDGLDLSDKFLLFSGKISSPVTWNERDRTVKFTIISQLEDKEIGFSAEEGQFPYLPADLVGKAWPMIFGTVQDSPALQVNYAITGTTLTPVGVIAGAGAYQPQSNSGLGAQIAALSVHISALECAEACWNQASWPRTVANFKAADAAGKKADDYFDQANELRAQIGQISAQAQRADTCAREAYKAQIADANARGNGPNPVNILGGEDFPQNQTIILDIGGAKFTGHFSGTYFYISSRIHLELEETASNEASSRRQSSACSDSGGAGAWTKYNYRIDVPCGCIWADFFEPCLCIYEGWIVPTNSELQESTDPVAQQFWADAGSSVTIHSAEPVTYIVSIIPGTVLTVKAYKQFTGEKRLINVPTDLYTVSSVVYGTVTAVQIVFNKALSTIVDQGWSDDIYVTFQSTVGPNIVDILEYLIDTYTDLDWDKSVGEGGTGTFDHVYDMLTPFPANFPILDRKNTLTVLQEIAYQARCALWISNGVFYIKYLPEVPSIDDTITVSDVDAEKGIEVDLTPTEDLVTKMTIKWRISWAPGSTDREKDKSEKHIILRHNVARYGTQEEEYDFYIYNQPDTVLKCATFWLIRKSHTWKFLKFKTFLNKLNLETFDCVNLNFAGGYVATGAVKAIVNKASYNSADNTVDFECTVPVRAGTMILDVFYWPAALADSQTWPPQEDIDSGDAGGGGIGVGATGNLPIGDVTGIEDGDTVFVGGPNVVFRTQSDWGDPVPTDIGFTAQTITNTGAYGELDTTSRPKLNLRIGVPKPVKFPPHAPTPAGVTIDLYKTLITDSTNPDNGSSSLHSLIYGINKEGQLLLKAEVSVGEEAHEEGAPFNFKYDDDGEVYGSKIAFLKE